jgi:hypothetical protein
MATLSANLPAAEAVGVFAVPDHTPVLVAAATSARWTPVARMR